MSSSRRYTEKDVAAILQRAAELQVEAPGQRSMSLDEIERAAAEAGLDPALVRRAAEEVARGEAARTPSWLRRLLGGPSRLKWEMEIAGEIDESAHERILEAIHATLSEPGHVSTTGRTLTWTIINQTRNFSITVTPRDGRTVLRIEDRLGNLLGGIYGGVLGGVGGSATPLMAVGGGALLGPLGALAGGLIGFFASYGLTRGIYSLVTRKREESLTRVVESIRAAVEDCVDEPTQDLHTIPPAQTTSALEDARERQGLKDAPAPAADQVAVVEQTREEKA